MAHFYGTLQGSRGEATRLGTKNSGLHVKACSYEGAIRVVLRYDPDTQQDIATVTMTRHMSKGTERILYKGPVGRYMPLICPDCCTDSDEYYVLDILPDGSTRCPNCKTERIEGEIA